MSVKTFFYIYLTHLHEGGDILLSYNSNYSKSFDISHVNISFSRKYKDYVYGRC